MESHKIKPTLVNCLKIHNRKERYWLLKNALGDKDLSLPLSSAFCDLLSNKINERRSEENKLNVPETAWWAMDYHIDWLFSALSLYRQQKIDKNFFKWAVAGADTLIKPSSLASCINGTQEDFDFIIAYDDTIILIEAKGESAWKKQQLKSKYNRIFMYAQSYQKEWLHHIPDLKIYLVIMSPKESEKLKADTWEFLSGIRSGEKSINFIKFDNSNEKDPKPFFIPLKMGDFIEKDGEKEFAIFIAPQRCIDNLFANKDGQKRKWRKTKIVRENKDRPS